MDIQNTPSAYPVSLADYVPSGGTVSVGHGGRASTSVLDEDLGPASVDVAVSRSQAEFGFSDLLDVVNPLQHIPVVSTLYRSLTGDQIGPVARVVGGTLYGGPIGAGMAVANAIMEQETGRDIGDTVLAMVTGDEAPGNGTPGDTLPQVAMTTDAAAQLQTAPATPAEVAAAAKAAPAAGQPQLLPAAPGTIQAGALFAAPTAARQNPAAAQPTAQPAVNQQAMRELGVGRDVPQLSPAAFQTLMNSIGAQPMEAASTPKPQRKPNEDGGLASGAEVAPGERPVVPAAAMEVHNLLQGFANRGQRQ